MTGHKIVPIEATEAMKLSGARSIGATMNTTNHAERANSCWQAMRAAAPRHEISDAEVGIALRAYFNAIKDRPRQQGKSDAAMRAALEAFRDGLEKTK